MSLKHEVNEMIAEKIPGKGNQLKNGIVASGLRKRPQMEQVVDYLNFGQEKAQFPDREAKLIRNHPFMTQLDFFDMQEDQERKWEDETHNRQATRVAQMFGMSAAEVRAMEPRTGSTRTADGGSQTDAPRTADGGAQTEGMQASSGPPTTKNKAQRFAGKQAKRVPVERMRVEQSSGSGQAPVYINQPVTMYVQHPVLTTHPTHTIQNNTSTSGFTSSMQQGVTYRPPQSSSAGAIPQPRQNGKGPYGRQPPPSVPPIAAAVATRLAQQDQGVTDTIDSMNVEARKRLAEVRGQSEKKSKAMQENVNTMLGQPVYGTQSVPVPMPTAAPSQPLPVSTAVPSRQLPGPQLEKTDPMKRGKEETEGARVKRQVQQHTGEPANIIPFLQSSTDIMDLRAA